MFEIFFYFVSCCIVICSFLVVTLKNPVYSVLFLILTFFTVSFILFLFEVEFLPLIFVIIYVGAVAVLFLFVVMMLDIKLTNKPSNYLKHLSISWVFGLIFIMKIAYFIDLSLPALCLTEEFIFDMPVYINWIDNLDNLNDLNCLGQFLYTYFFVHFLLAGFLLLLAVVGAIALTLRINAKAKNQVVYRQLARSSNSSFFVKCSGEPEFYY